MLQPALQRHVGKYYGKYSGEVTDNTDEEHLGRLKVRVPSIFGQQLEVRARPCLPYGHFFIPPVGTKVWVEFEAGDTQYPLWVGTWYPTGATPTEAAASPPLSRVIHTASGHTIELGDEDGEEKIVIRHRASASLSIDKDGSITLQSKHGHELTLGDGGAVLKNKEGSQLELSGNTARLVASTISLPGTSVLLGEDAAEPTLNGNAFKQLWDLFILHTHATAVGPSGPPVPPAQPLAPGVHLTSIVKVK